MLCVVSLSLSVYVCPYLIQSLSKLHTQEGGVILLVLRDQTFQGREPLVTIASILSTVPNVGVTAHLHRGCDYQGVVYSNTMDLFRNCFGELTVI